MTNAHVCKYNIEEQMELNKVEENASIQTAMDTNSLLTNLPTISSVSGKGITLRQISFSDLTTASNHWNTKMIIGRGMFGCVYRGTLKKSSIAIKSYSVNHFKHLLTEIYSLKVYQHKNIISLVGYCFDLGHEVHLVYQCMLGGSLSQRLKTKNSEKVLTWQQRLRIATGTARGIQYLHNSQKKPLVHGDINAANILLGLDEEPRIGDFGTAHECSHVSATEKTTGKLLGTAGYLPPEYTHNQLTSTKLDVYSFGVVLFRLATGLSACLENTKPPRYLRDVVIEHKRDIYMLEDSRVKGGKEHFEGLLNVGKMCVEELPEARADMPLALQLLEKISEGKMKHCTAQLKLRLNLLNKWYQKITLG